MKPQIIRWPYLILGLAIGIIIGVWSAEAHTPCGEDYQSPQCGYVQVVNPLSGKLEQQYICE